MHIHYIRTIHSLGGDEKGLYLITKEEFEIRCLCIGNVLLLNSVDSQLFSPVNNISREKPVKTSWESWQGWKYHPFPITYILVNTGGGGGTCVLQCCWSVYLVESGTFWQGFGSGSAWIRINLSCWIRIRIRNLNADPDPGGQKWPTKIEKRQNFHVLKCLMFSFEGWRLLL